MFPGVAGVPPPHHPQPRNSEWFLSAMLFLATFISTTFAGLSYVGGDGSVLSLLFLAMAHPQVLVYGLPFSFTFLMILLAHELGHFFACRYYGIRCTPPYFLPFPITFAGTLGAFIRIKSPFPHRKALFDVGVAGPLAGFVFVLPALVIGISRSQIIPKGSFQGGIGFGEPLLFRGVAWLLLGYSPKTQDMMASPVAMAAWFGLLATSLNLFPIWQLDGGHIAYTVLGRSTQKKVSIVGAAGLIVVSFLGWPVPSYLVFGLLLLALGMRFRFYHPPPLDDSDTLGPVRFWIALLALIILVVSFIPVPVSLS